MRCLLRHGIPTIPQKLVIAADDRAIHDEAGRLKAIASRTGDKSVIYQPLYCSPVCLAKVETLGNRLLGPCGQVDIPQRASTALAWVPAQHIEWVAIAQHGGIQTLALKLGTPGGGSKIPRVLGEVK